MGSMSIGTRHTYGKVVHCREKKVKDKCRLINSEVITERRRACDARSIPIHCSDAAPLFPDHLVMILDQDTAPGRGGRGGVSGERR